MTDSPGLKMAIAKAGTVAELARRLGVTRSAVAQWRLVPPRRVIPIEQATGVRREQLRPDLYPADEGVPPT